MENPINRDQEDYAKKFLQEENTINYIRKTHEQLAEALEFDKKRGAEMKKFRTMVTGKDARFHGNQTILHACNEYDLLFAQTRRVPLGEAFIKNLSNRDFVSVPECHDWWRVAYWNVFGRLKEFFQGVHAAATSMERSYKQAEWTVFEIKRRCPSPIRMDPDDTDPMPSGAVSPSHGSTLRILTNQPTNE